MNRICVTLQQFVDDLAATETVFFDQLGPDECGPLALGQRPDDMTALIQDIQTYNREAAADAQLTWQLKEFVDEESTSGDGGNVEARTWVRLVLDAAPDEKCTTPSPPFLKPAQLGRLIMLFEPYVCCDLCKIEFIGYLQAHYPPRRDQRQ